MRAIANGINRHTAQPRIKCTASFLPCGVCFGLSAGLHGDPGQKVDVTVGGGDFFSKFLMWRERLCCGPQVFERTRRDLL